MRNLCGLLAFMGLIAIGALPVTAADPPSEIALALDATGSAAKVITPLRGVEGGVKFRVSGNAGEVTVCGKSIKIGAMMKFPTMGVGLDENGDGDMARNEWKVLPRTQFTVAFKVKLDDGKTYPLVVDNFGMRYKQNNVTSFYGDLYPGWAMKGRVDREQVLLIDSNLDGQYTQDGEDAIALGNSNFALPLRHIHDIGGKHYELEVATDGATIKLTAVADVQLGQVETKFPNSMLKCLVLQTSEGHCYDVAQAGGDAVPAGTYQIAYGVLARGRDIAFLLPPEETTYAIQAGGVNTLRLGPEFMLVFGASSVGDKIEISPSTSVMGAGGERYRFTDEPSKPYAYFHVGERKVAGGAFAEG